MVINIYHYIITEEIINREIEIISLYASFSLEKIEIQSFYIDIGYQFNYIHTSYISLIF